MTDRIEGDGPDENEGPHRDIPHIGWIINPVVPPQTHESANRKEQAEHQTHPRNIGDPILSLQLAHLSRIDHGILPERRPRIHGSLQTAEIETADHGLKTRDGINFKISRLAWTIVLAFPHAETTVRVSQAEGPRSTTRRPISE